MSTAIVLTVIGKDHPGIVNILSDILAQHDGNWTESSMSTLAGQFAGILLATVPAQRVEACIAALKALDSQGLEVIAHASSEPDQDPEAVFYALELVGHDRHGIVQEITDVLVRFGVNICELETEVVSASMAGGPLFKAHARLAIPVDADLVDLERGLESIANELMVEFRREH